MTGTTQAEIAAPPASSQTTTAPEPSPAPAAAPSAEPTAESLRFDANALEDMSLFTAAPPAADAPSSTEAAVATTTPAEPAAPSATDPAPDPEPTETAGANPPPTEGSTEQPPPPPEPPSAPTHEDEIDGLSARIRTANLPEADKRAIAYRQRVLKETGESISIIEAAQLLEKHDQQAAQAAAKAAEEAAAQPDPIANAEQEIAEIEAKLNEAAEAGSLFTPELKELQKTLTKKLASLEVAKYRRETEQANAAATQTAEATKAFKDSQARGYDKYPTAQDPDSRLGLALAAVVAQWKAEDRPELYELNGPERVIEAAAHRAARSMAKEDGITVEQALAKLTKAAPATAPTPVTAPAPGPQPAAGKVTTAPGNRTVATPAAAPTAQELLKQSLLDPRIADEALGYSGTSSLFG